MEELEASTTKAAPADSSILELDEADPEYWEKLLRSQYEYEQVRRYFVELAGSGAWHHHLSIFQGCDRGQSRQRQAYSQACHLHERKYVLHLMYVFFLRLSPRIFALATIFPLTLTRL